MLGAVAELADSFDGTAIDLAPSATSATAYAWNYDTAASDTPVIDVVCAVVN